MTRIVIVGCGFPQLSILRRARALGLDVVGCDASADAIGVDHVNEFAKVSTTDVDGVAQLVTRVGARAIATTGSEHALRTTAQVASRLELPFYADPETIRRCQDKDAMRAAYEAAGLAVPPFASCASADDARAFAARHGYPLVVKPARGWGQRAVARVDDESELETAFVAARDFSATSGLAMAVVEAWLAGREYSVNGWIEDGALVSYCVTERLTVPGKRPLGVMIAEVYPSGLAPSDEARVIDEARRGAAALGLTGGPCYSQVAFGTRAQLFETAARLGGGFDADVTALASGVDLYARVLGVALGDASLERSRARGPVRSGAIAKFLIARPGAVTGIAGLDAARALPGVADAQVFVRDGGRVYPLTDSGKRAAYVLAHGATRDLATASADAALAEIRISTRDDDG